MIYLDYNATTPCDPEVIAEMTPYFGEHFGNAASTHSFGIRAAAAVDVARERVSELIGGQANEIVFCSGATEANNLALLGSASAWGMNPGKHALVSSIEHSAVLDCIPSMQAMGWEVSVLKVEGDGRIAPESLRRELRDETALVSIMFANNETGTMQDIKALAEVVKGHNKKCVFHTDAAQALGKVEIQVGDLGVDLVSLSAHKIYGPKGIGALWRRRRPRVPMKPLLHGGGHEGGMRSGTAPVPLIVGFGKAAELARQRLSEDARHMASLRDRLWDLLSSAGLSRNGSGEFCLPNTLNLATDELSADALMLACPQLAISSGAACSSLEAKPSHVITSLFDAERAKRSFRLSVGRLTSAEEVERAAQAILSALRRAD